MNEQEQQSQADRESDPEFLSFKVRYFERLKNSALYRQARLSELMNRPGAKKWTPKKVAKMTRRFVATQEMIKTADQAIVETNTKISTLNATLSQSSSDASGV